MTVPASYLGQEVPGHLAAAWNRWEGVEWRKGAHYARNELNTPDQRFSVIPPGGMCKLHLEMRGDYRDMSFNDRTGNRWPGTHGSPFTIIDRDLRRELAWRRAEWDEKAGEQMRLIEDICLSGRSPQCEGPRTCTGCARMTCTCEEEAEEAA